MKLVIPTDLTPEQIIEFKRLYKKYYGIDLTDEEAVEKGIQFLQFMTIIIENTEEFFD